MFMCPYSLSGREGKADSRQMSAELLSFWGYLVPTKIKQQQQTKKKTRKCHETMSQTLHGILDQGC